MAANYVRPNANIPPLPLELQRIKQILVQNHGVAPRDALKHEHYANGVACVKYYWKQATNMTVEEQREYIDLVENAWFIIEPSAKTRPSNHRAKRNNGYPASWPKWVLLNALYPATKLSGSEFQGWAVLTFGDYVVSDFTADYRTHYPCPRSNQRKRPAENLALPVAKRATAGNNVAFSEAQRATAGNNVAFSEAQHATAGNNVTSSEAQHATAGNNAAFSKAQRATAGNNNSLSEADIDARIKKYLDERLTESTLRQYVAPLLDGLLKPMINNIIDRRLLADARPVEAANEPDEDEDDAEFDPLV